MNNLKNTETELRFLVKGNSWKKSGKGIEIQQRFISLLPQRTVRIRIYGSKAYLTIKGEKIDDTNIEFEWEIPKKEALEMFKMPSLFEGHIIRKKRYIIPDNTIQWKHQPLTWELDEFLDENGPLRIAEIELPGLKTHEEKEELRAHILLNLPEWAGDHLDYISDPSVSRYFNVNLAKRPFSLWEQGEKEQMLRHLG